MGTVNKTYVANNRQEYSLVIASALLPNGSMILEFRGGYGMSPEAYYFTEDSLMQKVLEEDHRFGDSYRLAKINNMDVAEYNARLAIEANKKEQKKVVNVKVAPFTPVETPETVVETPAETVVETVVETPAETVVETVVETPAETPAETVVETVVETPAETVVETPAVNSPKPFTSVQSAKDWLNKTHNVPFSLLTNKDKVLGKAKELGITMIITS